MNTVATLNAGPSSASPIAALLAADGYKQSHRMAYTPGTTAILINWTNRSNRFLPDATHAVHFGVQAFCQQYLNEAWAPFFAAHEDTVATEFEKVLLDYFGPNDIGSDHIRALHRKGYLPLVVRSLPEGTLAPIGIATVLIENTDAEFFWLPNYIETALSASIWHPTTVATISSLYRELVEEWGARTGGDADGIGFQAHDFSFRGQHSIDAAAASGAGHLLSFLGTDTMSALDWISRYYPGENGWVGASVPATEHSVMCLEGRAGELDTFQRILKVFPEGIVSTVADGFDFWGVLTNLLPQMKDQIMARDGKLVIRPDSGDPVDIITGEIIVKDQESRAMYEAEKAAGAYGPADLGAIEVLGDLFGYTVNERGYKELDSHIGLIYGDSITLERAKQIFERLEAKGWASTNVVLGIGSYTFAYLTRDVLGSAVKATWALVNGNPVDIQKDPKTGSGKKSAKGRLAVLRDETGELYMVEQATPAQEKQSEIRPVWIDGQFVAAQSFAEVRSTLEAERAARAERRARDLVQI
ncbi:nicotinate phosphoribosyltransferase [Leifsonia sp. Leaf336]|uniref:nicotinate phosphoribosyltransferase n=1 Tax=Leifsonia sp. Leaf336 TaxID=1736341 RepID=UPI0006F94D93|nr:nicotinate phosphoribosyltransferase [Leifsonia sp. Leaf336]KQR51240.1 nicotinate phosphoribosyltransferase [Leifsonia sp. Leaf336]